jgi:hypothetical protein
MFLERQPGTTPPRDITHLRHQQTIIEFAARGSWSGRPEVAIRAPDGTLRSIDVLLERRERGQLVVVEVWDLLVDIGEAFRGLDRKVEAVRLTTSPGASDRVRALMVVQASGRNRALVGELATLIAARFPGRGRDWLAALGEAAIEPPTDDGFLWSSVRGGRLVAPRLGAATRTGPGGTRLGAATRTGPGGTRLDAATRTGPTPNP